VPVVNDAIADDRAGTANLPSGSRLIVAEELAQFANQAALRRLDLDLPAEFIGKLTVKQNLHQSPPQRFRPPPERCRQSSNSFPPWDSKRDK
jgi:hypothetical protein